MHKSLSCCRRGGDREADEDIQCSMKDGGSRSPQATVMALHRSSHSGAQSAAPFGFVSTVQLCSAATPLLTVRNRRRKNPERKRQRVCRCSQSQTGGRGLAKQLLTIHEALLHHFLAVWDSGKLMFTVRPMKNKKDEEISGAVPPSSAFKHRHLLVLFSLPTAPPGNLVLLIHSYIYSDGGMLKLLKVCTVFLRWQVFVFTLYVHWFVRSVINLWSHNGCTRKLSAPSRLFTGWIESIRAKPSTLSSLFYHPVSSLSESEHRTAEGLQNQKHEPWHWRGLEVTRQRDWIGLKSHVLGLVWSILSVAVKVG